MDFKRIYEFYKVTLTEEKGENIYGDCPFLECQKEDHFSVNTKTGLYRCLKCGASGNHLGFITEFHHQFLALTPLEKYKELAKARGISSKVLQLAELAYDENYDRWLVPFQNGSKFLNNLGVFWPGTSNPYRILKAPELPIKLYRPFDKKKFGADIHAFEGEWDLYAAKSAFLSAGIKAPSLISTSGATTWTPDMNEAVKGSNVVYFFNQDKGGEDGKKCIQKKAKGFTFSFASWKAEHDAETINDVRDLWKSTPKADKPQVALTLLDMANLPEATSSPEESGSSGQSKFQTNVDEIESVEEYDVWLNTLKAHMYLNDSMRRSYELMLATALSVKLPDKPIWMMLVGPASIGKSAALESLGGSNKFFDYTSKLTAESFVSGFDKGDNDSISAIATLNGKTFVIGDLTVILSLPITVQEKLWGMLREAYGGVLKVTFGNQAPKEYYGTKFCMIAGVTHAIYQFNESDMGERFVKVDFGGRDFDEDAQMDQAMANQDKWNEIKKILCNNMLGYYKHLTETTDFTSPPEVSREVEDKIKLLAKLATRLRTKVAKDKYEGMIARPVAESPTRFALILKTLAKSMMWVRQETEVTDDIYQTLQKVAFDSCPGLAFEVVNYIHKMKECSQATIVSKLRIPKTRVHQILTDFSHLDILEKVKVNNGTGHRGRDALLYKLTDNIANCLDGTLSHSSNNKFKTRPTKKKFKTVPRKKIRT